MLTSESLTGKITTTEELRAVVKTVKAMAAVSIRHYEKAVDSLGEYNRIIEMGLQILLRNRPEILPLVKSPPGQGLGAIIFGSDQGMCGQFNEQITAFALEQIQLSPVAPEKRLIIAVGERLLAHLEEAGQPIAEYFTLPGSLGGITPKVQEIVLMIEQWRSRRGINQIIIFHNQPVNSSSYRPRSSSLLPIDLAWLQSLAHQTWPSHNLPAFSMDWPRLFHILMGQYFFVSLYRAFAESLASENASRLASMQGAENNIEDRLIELKRQFHQLRQSSITEELLDIVSGFTALTDGGEIT
jgi:F-type H+-transporting ATPase subunit gamma